MDPSIYTAATGMRAQQKRIEVISNNLANVNTTAFKRSRAQFEDLLYQTEQGATTIQGADADTTQEIQIGRGVRLAGVQRVQQQGSLEITERSTDLAIEGDGLFQVQLPDGSLAYTRDGGFSISDQRTLVTRGGYTVMPAVDIPADADSLTISPTGVVTVTTAGSADGVEVGRIQLARFTNPSGLRAMGENLFQETIASGAPTEGFPQEGGLGRVMQGALEGSNVEIVQEMVDMITAMRAYEINSKSVQSSEQMAEIANNLVR